MTLSYISVAAKTGAILADLTDLVMSGPMPKTLMRYESQSAKLPLDSAPVNWITATDEKAATIICLAEDGTTPLWGGWVITRETDETDWVTLSLATIESYFDGRYVGDETFTGMDQNLIVQYLVNKYAGDVDGIPIRVQIVGGAGMVRDHSLADAGDKTLYSVLGELSGLIGGPEWTVGWEVVNNLYTPVLYVGTRIGNAVSPGLGPNATFELPGPVTKAKLVEAYSSGQGANNVMATSSGIGTARPQSPPQTPPGGYGNRPRVDHRWSPGTSITTIPDLTAHAQRALGAMKDGSKALTITASRTEKGCPQLGAMFGIGDDVGFNLTTKAWTTGLKGTARVMGWQLDDNTITPIVDVSSGISLAAANLALPAIGATIPDQLFDGGNATSVYVGTVNLDGGNATSIYARTFNFDGGTA